MVPTWKTKKGKTSEFLDVGGYNRIERAGNWQLGMGRQRGVEKENLFTIGTETCENIKNLYIKLLLLLLLLLGDEEREDLEIRGCRRLQQE